MSPIAFAQLGPGPGLRHEHLALDLGHLGVGSGVEHRYDERPHLGFGRLFQEDGQDLLAAGRERHVEMTGLARVLVAHWDFVQRVLGGAAVQRHLQRVVVQPQAVPWRRPQYAPAGRLEAGPGAPELGVSPGAHGSDGVRARQSIRAASAAPSAPSAAGVVSTLRSAFSKECERQRRRHRAR
ncbi:hypothetical protein [Kitasatospora acidiphila]|uniref:hypothetical protein n=1 Tax=Kitasatospora acidiphila TaxID=2567942 RepID=UPI003C757872